MKLYQLCSEAGIDGLVQSAAPEPRPAAGQVLVRVRASSLNYRDLRIVESANGGAQNLPLIPLSDCAGEVVALGEGVTGVRIGERVAGCFFQAWATGPVTPAAMASALGGAIPGVLAEYVVLRADAVVALPAHLSFAEGASLPCAALTAWHALIARGGLSAADTILTLGSGGVSVFALQFAKMHGARVISTSSADAKLARMRELGADETVNYRTEPQWQARVLELSGGLGVDHVLEVGGAGTLERSLQATRIGGRVSLIGILTGSAGEVNPVLVMRRSIALQGIYVGSREMFLAMNRAITAHGLRPVIDRVFAFNEAREAYRYLKAAGHFGKIVIDLDQ